MKHTYDLSIGLIVKNEERVLKRCLESLMPLKQGLKCEIIITDTGSTDGSIEIAKEYADKFIEFEWCDDFAKARNTGVDAAEGKWFMQIDADEFFDEDVMEIVRFIKRKDSDKYNIGTFTIRNYKSRKLTIYSEGRIGRLYNFIEGKRKFVHAIHESIPADVSKAKIMNCIIHHDGYRSEVINSKKTRNATLMELEVEKNPRDIRLHCLLVDVYVDKEKRLEVCERAVLISENTKNVESPYYMPFLKSQHIRALYEMGEYKKVIEKSSKYIESQDVFTNSSLDISYLTASAYGVQQEYKKAIEYYQKYLDIFKSLKKQSDEKYGYYGVYSFANYNNYLEATVKMIQCYIRSGQKEIARTLLVEFQEYDYIDADESLIVYEFYVHLVSEVDEFNLGLESYRQICEKQKMLKCKKDLRNQAIDILETQMNKVLDEEKKERIIGAFLRGETRDGYEAVQYLRFHKFKTECIDEKILEIISEDNLLYKNIVFSEYLYYNMLNGNRIEQYETFCKLKKFYELVMGVLKNHSESRNLIFEQFLNKEEWRVSVKNSFVVVLAYAYLVSFKESKDRTDSEKIVTAFELFLETGNKDIKALYQEESIEENIELLPDRYGFVYTVYSQWSHCKANPIAYIRALRKGIEICEELGEVVEIVAKEIERSVKREGEVKKEFLQLGIQVKRQIRSLIANDSLEAAKTILNQYEKVNPTDMEIIELFEMMHK